MWNGAGEGDRTYRGCVERRTPTIYDPMPDDTRVVNQQETTAAREAQQKLNERFSEWVQQDEARAQRLSRLYNDKFDVRQNV
jgi:N12 class adenine-specific DNA methylase